MVTSRRESRRSPGSRRGLPGLRRGTVTRLLFLYECTTREVTQLKSIASELGITIQAVSASFRALRREGLIEYRAGRYRATVAGVAWLHGILGDLGKDVESRLASLSVVR